MTGDEQAIIRIVEVLPAPFGPEEAERLAGVDVEVDAVDRGERVEALGQSAGMDQDIALDGHGTADCSDGGSLDRAGVRPGLTAPAGMILRAT